MGRFVNIADKDENGNTILKNVDIKSFADIPSLDSFQSRSEFNKWKQQQESFTNRNNQRYKFVKNEFGVAASQSLINEINRNRNREIKAAKEELKKRKKDPKVKQELLKMAKPDSLGVHIPKKFNFKEVRSNLRLEDIMETTKRRSDPEFYPKRMVKMQETFINELEKAFNSDANWLIDKIREMSPDEFLNMYGKYNSFDFRVFYILKYVDEFEANKYLHEMERDFERYQTDERAKDLKDF